MKTRDDSAKIPSAEKPFYSLNVVTVEEGERLLREEFTKFCNLALHRKKKA